MLKYERVNHVDDQDQRTLAVTDQYPAGVSETQPGAIVMTINLQGDKATYMKQYVENGGDLVVVVGVVAGAPAVAQRREHLEPRAGRWLGFQNGRRW